MNILPDINNLSKDRWIIQVDDSLDTNIFTLWKRNAKRDKSGIFNYTSCSFLVT